MASVYLLRLYPRISIIGNYFADLKLKGQQIIESISKVKLNERQVNVFNERINDIKSTITNRDMTEETRRCLERIRKQTGKSLKHWCVTELGEENDRIHLHGIVFGQRAAELVF
jgi:hypothetical protein